MKKVMLITIVSSVVMLGCSKEEIEIKETYAPNVTQVTEYIPLAVGNYWVYETVRIDTLGNETALTVLDSAYIDRDTVVNGSTYYIVSGGPSINHIMGSTIRNSGNEIVNLNYQGLDKTLFSSYNLGSIYRTDTIISNPYSFFSKTKTSPTLIIKNINAGSFNCYEGISELTQFIPSNIIWSKTEKRYYEKSVGIVAGQYVYYSSPYVFELRLLRYHLN